MYEMMEASLIVINYIICDKFCHKNPAMFCFSIGCSIAFNQEQ